MIIRCPECQFERSIDSGKIPSSAAIATCPKCRHRFRFRDLAPDAATDAGTDVAPDAAPDAAANTTPDSMPGVDEPQRAGTGSGASAMSPNALHATGHAEDRSHSPAGDQAHDDTPYSPPVSPAAPGDDDDLPATFRRSSAPPAGDDAYAGEHDHVGEPRPFSGPDIPGDAHHTPDAENQAETPERTGTTEQPAPKAAPHGLTDRSRPGDDPLPPGAVIPGRHHPSDSASESSPRPSDEGQRKGGSPRDIWDAVASVGDRWRKQSSAPRDNRHDEHDKHGEQNRHGMEEGRFGTNLPRSAADRRTENHNDRPDGTGTGTPPWGASARSEVPWENLDRLGFFPGLYQTILRAMLSAPRFFSGVRSSGSLKLPVAFYLLLGMFQSLVERLWYIMSMRVFGGYVEDPQLKAWMGNVTHDMSLPMTLLLSPFTLLLQLAVLAGLYHFMIRLVDPRAADINTTVRVIAYSAAPTVLSVVPIVGPVAGSLWFVVCTFVGVKYAHRLPWSRTALAIGPLLGLGFALTVQVLRMFMSAGSM